MRLWLVTLLLGLVPAEANAASCPDITTTPFHINFLGKTENFVSSLETHDFEMVVVGVVWLNALRSASASFFNSALSDPPWKVQTELVVCLCVHVWPLQAYAVSRCGNIGVSEPRKEAIAYAPKS